MNNLVFFMLLMLCMAFHYMPVSWHEVLGIMLVLPFVRHLYSYRGWWNMLGKGRLAGGGLSLFSSLLNVLLLVAFVLVIGSGILVSGYIFREIIPLELRITSPCISCMCLSAIGLCYCQLFMQGCIMKASAAGCSVQCTAGRNTLCSQLYCCWEFLVLSAISWAAV